jgi:hypothetical protein
MVSNAVRDAVMRGRTRSRIVLDDRSRLPGRFFGRFTSALQLRR